MTSEKLTTKRKKLSIAWFKECQFVTQGRGICILIVMFLLSHYLQLEDQSEKEIRHHLWQSDSGTKNASEVSCCLKLFLSRKMYKRNIWAFISLDVLFPSFMINMLIVVFLADLFFLLSLLISSSFLKYVNNSCLAFAVNSFIFAKIKEGYAGGEKTVSFFFSWSFSKLLNVRVCDKRYVWSLQKLFIIAIFIKKFENRY